MPRKPATCTKCGKPRQSRGRFDVTGLCWGCWLAEHRPKSTAKERPGQALKKAWGYHQQHQAESQADRERRYPKTSWWASAPREAWGEVVEAQRKDRLQAGGCGVPATQRGLGGE